MAKIQKEMALAMLKLRPQIEIITQIIKDSDYEAGVCYAGVKLLRDLGWINHKFWTLIAASGYRQTLITPCLPFITLVGQAEQPIMSMLRQTDFRSDLLNLALAALDITKISETDLRQIMIRARDNKKFLDKCWPLFKLNQKNEDELWTLLTLLQFLRFAKLKICPLLYSENRIIVLINKSDPERDDDLRKMYFRKLAFKSLSDQALYDYVVRSGFDSHVCAEAIKHFKDLANVFLTALKGRDQWVTVAAIQRLNNEEEIMHLAKEMSWVKDVCLAALARLKSEIYILEILKRHQTNEEIQVTAFSRLPLKDKTEAELIDLTNSLASKKIACLILKPYFKLEAKNPEQIIFLLKELNFEKSACVSYLEVLDFGQIGEDGIFKLLVQSNYNVDVCSVLIPYIKSENHIMTLAKNMLWAKEKPWLKAFTKILNGKSDSEILALLKELLYDKEVCRYAINHMDNPDSIFTTYVSSGYDLEVGRMALTLIGKINRQRTESKNRDAKSSAAN